MISSATLIPIVSAFLAAIAGVLARVLLKDTPAKKMLAVNFLVMGGGTSRPLATILSIPRVMAEHWSCSLDRTH